MEKSHEYNQYMDEIIKLYDFSATSSTNSSIPLTYENFQRDQSQDYIGRIHSQIGFGTFVENIQQDRSRRDNIILDGAREEINANITSPPGPSPSFEAQTYLDGGYNTNYASFSGLDSSFGAHVTSFPGPPFVPSQPSQNNVQSIVNFLNSWFNDDVQGNIFPFLSSFVNQI